MDYEDLTIFLPFRGEFGHLIMWHAPIINAHKGKKIVFCEYGQESLFSNVTEYIFVDPRPEDARKTANAHSYDKKFFEELQGKHEKRFPGAKFVRPAGEFNESHPRKYVSYQPHKKYDIECDIVVCPRKRILAPDRNWEYWNVLTKKLKAAGYSVCAAGSPTASYKTPCVKAWSYERFLDATIEAIQKSKLVICTDSGLAHLAVQCGKPILMITFKGQPGPKTKWQVKWDRYNLENHTNSLIKSIDAWDNLNLVFSTAISMIKNDSDFNQKYFLMKKAINIGCGKDIRVGQGGYQWTNVDARKTSEKTEEVDVFGKFPYRDEEFDHVYACDILEHYSYRRTEEVLKEWSRILKTGGSMFIQVPCITTIIEKFQKGEVNEKRLIELLYGGQNYEGESWVFNSHYNCFSEAKFRDLFSETNMEIKSIKKVGNNLDVHVIKNETKKMNYNKEYWDKRYSSMGGKRTVGKCNWSDEQYEKFIETHHDSLKKCLQDHTKKGMVVDVGCGIGRWIPLLDSVYDDYLGVDISPQAIQEVKDLYPQKNFSIIDGDFRLNVVPQTIWTHVVLQHIIDDELLRSYAENFFANIDHGGTVIITESCKEVSSKSHYLAHRSYQDYKLLFEDVGFVCIYHQSHIPSHHTLIFKKESK